MGRDDMGDDREPAVYGYMPISRKMVDGHDPLWEAPEPKCVGAAWIDLLMLTRFAPGMMNGEWVERGEFCASVRFLANRWRWRRSKTYEFLKRLVRLQRISERRAGQRGTVYRVVNYDLFNPLEGAPRTPRRKPAGHLPDTSRTKIKKEKKETLGGAGLRGLVGEVVKVWNAETGGSYDFGRAMKEVKSLHGHHSTEKVLVHLREYFRQHQGANRKFVSLSRFVSMFGQYAPAGSVPEEGGDTEARYQYLASEARRCVDMSQYPDWPRYEARFLGRKEVAGGQV